MPQAIDDTITKPAGSNVIDFASRQHKRTQTPGSIGLQIPGSRHNLHSETLFKLPFVTLPSGDVKVWKDFWSQTTMWNDAPTEDAGADYHRGKGYAQAAIAAIVNDNALPRDLEIVVRKIVDSGFKRKGPAGKLCRGLASAEEGFLDELCKVAVEGRRLADKILGAGSEPA